MLFGDVVVRFGCVVEFVIMDCGCVCCCFVLVVRLSVMSYACFVLVMLLVLLLLMDCDVVSCEECVCGWLMFVDLACVW